MAVACLCGGPLAAQEKLEIQVVKQDGVPETIEVDNGELRKANSFYWKCIAAAGTTAASTFATCETGILESAEFKSWLKRKLPKYIPLACSTKALGAGIGVEIICAAQYSATLDAICIDLDIAVELCANAADRNYKKCDL